VDLTTREGRVCERYETYTEARRRVDQFSAESLQGLAFIFEELVEGSERLVREDGKPLQFHRRLVEDSREASGHPLPVVDDLASLLGPAATIRFVEPGPPDDMAE
jgi:hypothetical protein